MKSSIDKIKETFNHLTIENEYDHGVLFTLPGHSLFIANQYDGWYYKLESEFAQYPIAEENNLDLDECIELVQELGI